MSIRKNHLKSTTLLIALAALSLSACGNTESGEYLSEVAARFQPIRAVPDNNVETIAFEHVIAFPTGTAQAADAERRRLRDFVIASHLTSYDTIIVEGAPSGGGYDALTINRINAVAQDLVDVGLAAFVAEASTASSARGSDQIAVLVTRSVVVPPDCSIPPRTPGDWPDYEFGCNNNAALGMMVANPNDLTKGRKLGPADAEKASLAMERYRSGEQLELKEEGTN